MFIPRPPSPAAQAADPVILIVSHGSPSDPDPQEVFVRRLAVKIGQASGRVARGVTLAKSGALDRAVADLHCPLIVPHFMSDGWFVSTHLPKRLKAAGLEHWDTAPPLGMTAALPGVAAARLTDAVLARRMRIEETTLVVSAHGSPSDPRPAKATQTFVDQLRALTRFKDIRLGYVDEEPSLEAACTVTGPSLMLPFFAARAGHVLIDVPEAVEAAGYHGDILDPIGTWGQIPALVAAHLHTAESQVAA